jgi:hypothetical protein
MTHKFLLLIIVKYFGEEKSETVLLDFVFSKSKVT